MKPENPVPGQRERFLSRWSRLKRQDPDAPKGPAVPGASAAAASGAPSAAMAAAAPGAQAGSSSQTELAAALPPIDSLSIDSDFTPFLQPKVPDALRRAAVKKLFADPRFNVMDGLDVYIDDYSIPDPIPAEMMKMIEHARDLIDHPSDRLAREQALAAAAGPSEDVAAASTGPEADGEPDAIRATSRDTEAPGAERMTDQPPEAELPTDAQPESTEADRR